MSSVASYPIREYVYFILMTLAFFPNGVEVSMKRLRFHAVSYCRDMYGCHMTYILKQLAVAEVTVDCTLSRLAVRVRSKPPTYFSMLLFRQRHFRFCRTFFVNNTMVASVSAAAYQYPSVLRSDHVDVLHGRTIADPYR
jgi:hypothetical protein